MKRLILFLLGVAWLASGCTSQATNVTATVYFLNTDRYAVGTEPYEDPVSRTVPVTDSLPEVVLQQLFLGPTPQEKAAGLGLVLSGTTGFSQLTIQDGIARIYLQGQCNARGATYTIANLIRANLSQFPQIHAVKVYDENGQTEIPDGPGDSIPICLEP